MTEPWCVTVLYYLKQDWVTLVDGLQGLDSA